MVSIAGLAIEVFFFPHYAAPMTGLLYIAVLAALRRLQAWHWNNKPAGAFLARAVPAICLLLLVVAVLAQRRCTSRWHALTGHSTWYNGSVPDHRSRTRDRQNSDGYEGKHLVIVRYRP